MTTCIQDTANKENKSGNEDIELINDTRESKGSTETQDQSLHKERKESEQENHIQERKDSGDLEFEHKIASPHVKNKKMQRIVLAFE